MECQCLSCNRFFNYKRKAGGSKIKCNSCHVNDRRFKIRTKILNMYGNKCSICSYDKYKSALQFHHIDPSKKSFQISGAHSRSWKSIQDELKKCILICSNCHAGIHEGTLKI